MPFGFGDRVETLVCNYGPLDQKTPRELYEDGVRALCPQGTVRSPRYEALCRKCFPPVFPTCSLSMVSVCLASKCACVYVAKCLCAYMLGSVRLARDCRRFLGSRSLPFPPSHAEQLTATNLRYERREDRFQRPLGLLVSREPSHCYYSAWQVAQIDFYGAPIA